MILTAIVALAFIVEAASGFGATIVTVALAAQLYAIPEVLATFIPVNAALSTLIVLRYRHAVDGRLLSALVGGEDATIDEALVAATDQLKGHDDDPSRLAIVLSVLGITLVGESLNDLADPRLDQPTIASLRAERDAIAARLAKHEAMAAESGDQALAG